MSEALYAQLPGVDTLLEDARIAGLPRPLATLAARRVLAAMREEIGAGKPVEVGDVGDRVLGEAERLLSCRLRRVVNATGIVLHTNLGRAPLPPAAVERVQAVAGGYSNLEYDLETGQRGGRLEGVREVLGLLVGCEDALVVNNNAAAVLLALTALAADREVVVSRGELVEIGGSFRVPEILEVSGAKMVEVGTTNRTKTADYAQAIGEDTALLLRVHPSNFRMTGFTARPSTADLAALDAVLVEDLGSGALQSQGEEPLVAQVLADGADLVTFSGDKLLGGSQAGVLVGRADLVARARTHPLYRALRLDKLALAALEATLRLHLAGDTDAIPASRMLGGDFAPQAQRLAAALAEKGLSAVVEEDVGFAGGGSLPGEELPASVVAIRGIDPGECARKLRQNDPPVIARVARNALLLDPRTLLPGEEEIIVDALSVASSGKTGQE